MSDKTILKQRFKKSLATYSDNAIVQKQMAQKLLNILPQKQYNNILELGCGSGVLTNLALNKFKYNSYLAGDIVEECAQYIRADFFVCDIDNINLNQKYDLIISNAALQWSEDLDKTVNVLMQSLTDDGILAFTIFGSKNMHEIKNIFNTGLEYYTVEELKQKFKPYNILELYDEIMSVNFKSVKDILKHIKLTGVNALNPIKLSPKNLKELLIKYENLYECNLTYNPVWVVLKNSK